MELLWGRRKRGAINQGSHGKNGSTDGKGGEGWRKKSSLNGFYTLRKPEKIKVRLPTNKLNTSKSWSAKRKAVN